MNEERHCSKCGDQLPADAPQGLCPQCLMKLGLPSEGQTQNGNESNKFVPPELSELTEQFPQLEIIELLGQGGMGAVYKARQKQLDRLVALKILPPQTDQAEAFAERFTREARSLAKLNHSHIVTVHDFGHTEAGLYYFIMEFVDGTDLRRVIQTGELSEHQALAVVPQICEALQYAHEEGIVHRDIKPENILLNKKGQVKIADFGLAKLLDQPATMYRLTQAGQKMGTPHYMAPEQIEHPEQVDHRADIYSLGVVFYEMLTGELPLGHFPLPSRKVHIDVRLDEVVLKTLEKEPEMRYQHASEVKTDVETISTGESVSGSTRKFLESARAGDPIEAVRNRVWSPSMGLLIAGIINFLSIVGALFSIILSMIGSGFHGRFFPIFYVPGFARFFVIALMGTHAVFVVLGAWNLMQLRSYRLALVGSILAMIPSAGTLIGLPMGIWALILLHKDEIKNAFGQERTDVSVPPHVRQFAVSAVDEVKDVFSREKAEFAKIRTSKSSGQQQSDAPVEKAGLGLPIISFVFGLLGIATVSSDMSFPFGFAYGFVFVFFSIFLGIVALKKISNRRDQIAYTGLAVAGIMFGAIAGLRMLDSIF
jgi:serine/threonine protein kinase